MPRVLLDDHLDNLVTPQHSDARGPVVRGKAVELMKMHWRAGRKSGLPDFRTIQRIPGKPGMLSAREHHHPEEQVIYVVSGRMRMTVAGETYEVGPGEASYHPSNVPHAALAVEDTVAISFKNIVAPFYDATKTL